MKAVSLDYVPSIICGGTIIFILGLAIHDVTERITSPTTIKKSEYGEWDENYSRARSLRIRDENNWANFN